MTTDIDKLVASLDKELGENHGNQQVSQFIDTNYPPLNKIISGKYEGGLPFGRIVEMYGDFSSGKTALATDWMIKAQEMGGAAIFIDWERSFSLHLGEQLGLKTERPHWLYFKPETWEQGNMIANKACHLIRDSGAISNDAPILVVFDSIAAAVPKSQAEKELDELTMNDTTALARVSSTTLKTQAQHAEKTNATFLYLNQIRLKPGVVYGDPVTTPGGNAMKFFASVRLAISRTKIMEQSDGKKSFVGQDIGIKTVKNKITMPFQECKMRMYFGSEGQAEFDTIASMIDALVADGQIKASGPRVEWDGKSYFKKQLVEFIKENGLRDTLAGMFKSE